MPEPRTKVCYEDLFNNFKESASEWLKSTPEARGLMLVVDWKVGQTDFPPCSVVCHEPNITTTTEMIKQSLKLVDHLGMMLRQQLEHVKSQPSEATSQ